MRGGTGALHQACTACLPGAVASETAHGCYRDCTRPRAFLRPRLHYHLLTLYIRSCAYTARTFFPALTHICRHIHAYFYAYTHTFRHTHAYMQTYTCILLRIHAGKTHAHLRAHFYAYLRCCARPHTCTQRTYGINPPSHTHTSTRARRTSEAGETRNPKQSSTRCFKNARTRSCLLTGADV